MNLNKRKQSPGSSVRDLSGVVGDLWAIKRSRLEEAGINSFLYMGVSKKRGTPKWMVYNGKPY